MKKLSILLAAVILAVASLIAGCGSSSVADQFAGTWVSQSGNLYLSIEKQGNHTFIVNEYYYKPKDNAESYESYKGELKENILESHYLLYSIKDNKLVHNKGGLYTKVKDKALSKEELQELAKSK